MPNRPERRQDIEECKLIVVSSVWFVSFILLKELADQMNQTNRIDKRNVER